ncbi:MAG: hypothetical protein PVI23_13785 [Maricaulaceae bacterium]|jgi:hypothetical protein
MTPRALARTFAPALVLAALGTAAPALGQDDDVRAQLIAINASLEGVWEGQVVRLDPETGAANIYEDVIALTVSGDDPADFSYERAGQRVAYDHLGEGVHHVRAWRGDALIAEAEVRFEDVEGPNAAGGWSHVELFTLAGADGAAVDHRNEYAFENGVWSSTSFESRAGEDEFVLVGSASYSKREELF